VSFKGAIFDLDGVVVDTVPLHFKAWKKMFSEYGKNFTHEEYKRKVDGIPRLDGTRAVLTDLNDTELEKAAAKKQRYYLELVDAGEIETYRSTVGLIKELKKNKIRIAAASSSRNCRYILEKVGLVALFEAVIGGGDFKKGKPDPEIFLLAASRLKLSSGEVVVFEDAILGVEAAKNGGMMCVGIARKDDKSLLKKADIVVSDLGEIDYARLEELFNS